MKHLLLLLLCCLPLATQARDAQTPFAQPLAYRLVERQAHDAAAFTQGLLFHDGYLYESSGLYGLSNLRRYRPGDLEATLIDLPPQIFAEGLALHDGQLFLLTWKEHLLLRFDPDTLTLQGSQRLRGESWGLTSDGRHLIRSDGSDRLRFHDPVSLSVMASIAVRENDRPVYRLNELEWIDGRLFANLFGESRIVIIDPQSGVVSHSLDLSALAEAEGFNHDPDRVLNGIAWDPHTRSLWVTGKHWRYLYRLQLDGLNTEAITPTSEGSR